ncbi:4-hydroxybenzoate decarboxylase subunit C [Rosistilla carotiformis]|uniref:4-hydroxybenzoate decarboxylase subunit C n=1 Tax=Rosistilla carotiformis TaxID=2528017 RepID=A0A518JZB4_9BACT|nr:UbiD family decarboxylase [Rosistilla carotiformis]QDV70881.1 4-hydroxybenzoate decarboxylase subunit C [Rosistilla carotiformis]
MKHRSTRQAVDDLAAGGRLIRYEHPVDANLELAEIQRRVYLNGGPAVLFTNVTGCRFPMVSNLFGSLEQARYLFRHTIDRVRKLIELKIDPSLAAKQFWRYPSVPLAALTMLPRRCRSGAVMQNSIALPDLPQLKSWPDDGGAFVTLPQVLSQPADGASLQQTNLGMYRVQLSGNDYDPQTEVGMHYQIHRGIGVHHRAALENGRPFRVVVTVGGAPSMTLSAVMPLPEGLSELTFAGALAGHRIPMVTGPGHAPIYADADFAIVGTIDPTRQKPEGPFGDHLGYYSLQHDFPVLNVERVYHRNDAVWPLTVVGRPPQEDTTFGELIHDLTGPVIPTVLPGIKAVHAVDASGVHPLLLAIGSERYMPMSGANEPQELLTQANAVLGNGQLSLAKYLWIANHYDNTQLDIHDVSGFLQHMLQRVDWRRDLHFQTQTTIDTLDYSGSGLNRGSKVVIAAVGPVVRQLPTSIEGDLHLPEGFGQPKVAAPGILIIQGPAASASRPRLDALLTDRMDVQSPINRFPLVIVADDSDFSARTINNFVWTTFTRSNPAADVYGIGAFVADKHWGCEGSLVIDARVKPHHAPPLIEDPEIVKRVDAIAARGGALAKYL